MQSVVLRSHVVRLSVRNVGGSGAGPQSSVSSCAVIQASDWPAPSHRYIIIIIIIISDICDDCQVLQLLLNGPWEQITQVQVAELQTGIECHSKLFCPTQPPHKLLVTRSSATAEKQRVSCAVHVYLGWLTDRAMHRTPQNRRDCTISDIQTLWFKKCWPKTHFVMK